MAYLNIELERTTKEDYRFASIALEVRRGNVKDANKVSIEDVVVKMKATEIVIEEPEELDEEEEYQLRKQASKKSRGFWAGLLGLNKDK